MSRSLKREAFDEGKRVVIKNIPIKKKKEKSK